MVTSEGCSKWGDQERPENTFELQYMYIRKTSSSHQPCGFKYYHPHFIEEETQGIEERLNNLQTRNWQSQSQERNSDFLDSKAYALNL